ncbi:MAG: histidinol-phosphate transaminase [Coriobacteriales bacterium]|jgi:histidinol-phosphate aminotransferase|nr:histidinol-phosphate transaminase [Coriobacteriales bacterium]
MQRVRAAAPYLAGLTPYDPKYLPARIYLNANESPYGLPPGVEQELAQAVATQVFHRYPDPLAKGLRSQIAAMNSVEDDNVLLGNGGDELLFDIMLAYGGPGRALLTAPPSFSSYDLDAKLTGTRIVEVPRMRRTTPTYELGIDQQALLARVARGDIDVVMIASPNNPTGDALDEDFVLALLDASDTLVLIDQAYIEFADRRFDMTRHLADHKNLILLRTFSKAWALAGIRLGYLLGSPEVINELCKVRQPYSVDTFSVLAGRAVLAAAREIEARAQEAVAERQRVFAALHDLHDLMVFASWANFILFEVEGAHGIWQRLYDEQGILLRDFSAAPGLTNCLRVSIGTPAENDEFLAALRGLMDAAVPLATAETAPPPSVRTTAQTTGALS